MPYFWLSINPCCFFTGSYGCPRLTVAPSLWTAAMTWASIAAWASWHFWLADRRRSPLAIKMTSFIGEVPLPLRCWAKYKPRAGECQGGSDKKARH